MARLRTNESFENNKDRYHQAFEKICQLALYYGGWAQLADVTKISPATLSQYKNDKYRRLPSNASYALISQLHDKICSEADLSPGEQCFELLRQKKPGYRDKVKMICDNHGLTNSRLVSLCAFMKKHGVSPRIKGKANIESKTLSTESVPEHCVVAHVKAVRDSLNKKLTLESLESMIQTFDSIKDIQTAIDIIKILS